jgi:hypothetical protein
MKYQTTLHKGLPSCHRELDNILSNPRVSVSGVLWANDEAVRLVSLCIIVKIRVGCKKKQQ